MNHKKQNNLVQIHHGTCDVCSLRGILVWHYNYFKQPERDFRVCDGCYLKIHNEITLKSGKKLNDIRKRIADKGLFFELRNQKALTAKFQNIIIENKAQIKILLITLVS